MIDRRKISDLQNSVAYSSDRDAYKQLFYYFHPQLRRFACSFLHNAEIAEEIVSDVLLKIWIMREKLALVKDLKLYLFKAVRNAGTNYLKSVAHKKSLVTTVIEDEDEIPAHSEQGYIHTEMQQLMQQAINELPSKCQMVFRLIKEYGLSHAQAGAIMNISQNTIETHMRLALKKLKQVLDRYQAPGK